MTEGDAEQGPIPCRDLHYGAPRALLRLLDLLTFITGLVGCFVMTLAFVTGELGVLVWAMPLVATVAFRVALKRGAERGDGELMLRDDGGLMLAMERGAVVIEQDEIAWGARRGERVDFEVKGARKVGLTMPSEEAAERVLRATNTGVDQGTITLRLRSDIGPEVAGFGFFVGLCFPAAYLAESLFADWGARMVAMAAMALVGAWALVKIFVSPELEVGMDGLRLKRSWGSRFIPHEEIVEVVHSRIGFDGERLLYRRFEPILRDGSHLHVPTVDASPEDIERVVRRIHELWAERDLQRPAAEAFARRGRALDAWRDRLRAAFEGDLGFRQRRVTLDDAKATLADPKARIDERLGAALALRQADAERGEERIRTAVRVALEPRTKRILEAALDDDATLEAAFEELEAAEAEAPPGWSAAGGSR